MKNKNKTPTQTSSPAPPLTILMAAYNGEKYISRQIESILTQTHQNYTLHISDDASTDNTYKIATQYATQNPGKITTTQNPENTGSAKHNFINMMINQKNDYVMLSDQDDIWLPEKITKTMTKMKSMEAEHGTNTPILVHTDLKVVNENLKTINPSYKQAMNSDYTRTALNQVLIQNTVTGCTVMYNRALSELITQKPDYCVMHDWWLKLTASAFGKIGHIEEQTILYRQHSKNEVGAKDVRKLSYKLNRLMNGGSVKEAIRITYPQAVSFLETYKHKLTEEQRKTIEKYCTVPKLGKLARCRTLLSMGALKSGISRNIAYFIFV